VRGRLAQAFGRLIRRADDRGVFVLLGAAVPSRLLDAFPDGVPIRRLPLSDAIAEVTAMLGSDTPATPCALPDPPLTPAGMGSGGRTVR
jgi:ATP-dependent DNA helicase DinG